MAEQVKQEFHITISDGQVSITDGLGGFVPSGDLRILMKVTIPAELKRRGEEQVARYVAEMDNYAQGATWIFPSDEREYRNSGPCVYFMALRGALSNCIKIGRTVDLRSRFKSLQNYPFVSRDGTVPQRVLAFAKTAHHVEYERALLEFFRQPGDVGEVVSGQPVLDYLGKILESQP